MNTRKTILGIVVLSLLLAPVVPVVQLIPAAQADTTLLPLACVSAMDLGFESWNWNTMCSYSMELYIDPWNAEYQ